MRLIIVVLAALATGCLDTPAETTSTASSDLTYSFYSPRLEIVARITRLRQAADDLRAVGATKPPAYATWTVLQQHRSLVQFDYDSADQLDTLADAHEALLATATDLDSLSEMCQVESLRLQMAMDRTSKLMGTISAMLAKMSETAQTIIDNIK